MPLAEPLQQVDRTFVQWRGRKLTYFGGCDYFRLASHPDVLDALLEGAKKFGLNVAASRMTTGNHVLFGKLEISLAKFFGVERALLLSTGYATNLSFVQAFSSVFTHGFMDERSHGSLRDAAEQLRCPVISFRHRDAGDLARRLAACSGEKKSARPLVITDGLFSHDGSTAPLHEYLAALPRGGMLLVDDAHGGGTLGRTGKGTAEVCGVRDPRLVQTVSLSKAFGVYGGAVLATAKVIRAIQNASRIFKGNTPLPLPLVNAALTSLQLVKKDRPMRLRLGANTAGVKKKLLQAGFPVLDNSSPIVALVPRTRQHASLVTRKLLRAQIFPSLIRYADGMSHGYFRFAISSEHTTRQLDELARVLIASMR